jgi:hypothetical protein
VGRRTVGLLSRSQVIIVAVFVGGLYAAGSIARDDVVPGIVGGILAAVLMYLVILRFQDRRRAREQGRDG